MPAGLIEASRRAWHALEALLLPRACLVCGGLRHDGARTLACDGCWSRVRPLPHPQCDRCGHPESPGGCRWCLLLPAYVHAARSWCWLPGGTAARLVHALKYEGWHALADEIGARMARLALPGGAEAGPAVLVPVPLSARRRRTRGYNQAEELARAIGRAWRVPLVPDVLVRVRDTRPQARLGGAARGENVRGAFGIAPGVQSKIAGRHVILVDDVVTTATTLNACAGVLRGAGAHRLSYVTFGRARAPGDAPTSRG